MTVNFFQKANYLPTQCQTKMFTFVQEDMHGGTTATLSGSCLKTKQNKIMASEKNVPC